MISPIFFPSLIPELDRLFRISGGETVDPKYYIQQGIHVKEEAQCQIALSGPAGTGKSLLALHFAAGFAALHERALVIYVSTDMSFHLAQQNWNNFRLGAPNEVIQDRLFQSVPGWYSYPYVFGLKHTEIGFSQLDWQEGIHSFKSGDSKTVHFIDFQKSATGDDWHHLKKLLLQDISLATHTFDKILLVIDAVEGLDAPENSLHQDALRHSRRQRLAKLLEEASGLCSVVYTLEAEPRVDHIPEEEFVSDVVIRLDREPLGDSHRVTLEVIKARGMDIIPGVHHLDVKSGGGTKSFNQQNEDDPEVCRSYITLYPAIAWLERRIEESAPAAQTKSMKPERLKFNLPNFDDMLGGGLEPGSVLGLLGEGDTHKSRLAQEFLLSPATAKNSDEHKDSPCILFRAGRAATLDMLHQLCSHKVKNRDWLRFRKLPNRRVSAEELFFIITENLRWAVHTIGGDAEIKSIRSHFPHNSSTEASDIRVVIDDISILLASYGLLDKSDYIIPVLTDLLRLAGVTALIVDTRSGGPLDIPEGTAGNTLRSKVDRCIFTWKVPYGGGTKVALAVIPAVDSNSPLVTRELRLTGNKLEVDRCLELYSNVMPSQSAGRSELERVPLKVLLMKSVLEEENRFSKEAQQVLDLTLGTETGASSCTDLVCVQPTHLKELETIVLHSHESVSRETTVVMVDEFWLRRENTNPEHETKDETGKLACFVDDTLIRHHSALKDQTPLKSVPAYNLVGKSGTGNPANQTCTFPLYYDFGLMLIRANRWKEVKASESATKIKTPDPSRHKSEGWKAIMDCAETVISAISTKITDMESATRRGDESKACNHLGKNSIVFWHEFLAACQTVAERSYTRYDGQTLEAYEVDYSNVESLLCLILEMWQSSMVWLRMLETAKPADQESQYQHWRNISRSVEGEDSWLKSLKVSQREVVQLFKMNSLSNLLSDDLKVGETPRFSLYLALMTLVDCVSFDKWDLDDVTRVFVEKKSTGEAVAGRYWYSTGCELLRAKDRAGKPNFDPDDPLIPMALPGLFSVRGDWSLGVLKTSRSLYLGELAIQKLTGPKMTALRLQSGVGLPFSLGDNQHKSKSVIYTAMPSHIGGRLAACSLEHIESLAPRVDMKTLYDQPKDEDGKQENGAAYGHSYCSAIFRSQIPYYKDEHNLFLKIICSLITILEDHKKRHHRKWKDFVTVHGLVMDSVIASPAHAPGRFEKLAEDAGLQSYEIFCQHVAALKAIRWTSEETNATAEGKGNPGSKEQ